MNKILVLLTAGLFSAAAFAGCVGSDENSFAPTGITVFAKSVGDWTNDTFAETLTELMAPENREAPASRTRSAPTVTFKTDGAGAVTWDFGDGETLDADASAEVSHTFGVAGLYRVVVMTGGAEAGNITIAINYRCTGDDSTFPLGAHVEGASQNDRNYHHFPVNADAKKVVVETIGKNEPLTDKDEDVGLELFSPSGKSLGSSDSSQAQEKVESKKAKEVGNYVALVGALGDAQSNNYVNYQAVEYTLIIEVLYA